MVDANKKKTTTGVTPGAARLAAATKTTATKPTGAAAARSNSQKKTNLGKKVVGAQRDDYECPVCLELCAQPVLTPCKHFMCF